jgi:NADH pyrophosphatase NudC (nudix superfamily)
MALFRFNQSLFYPMKSHILDRFRFCPACGSEHFVSSTVKSKRCEACGFEFFLNASASTAAFIVNARGELLACRRAKEPARGTLDLPGGFVDADETVEECLSRELMEEIGCRVRSACYLFSVPNRYLYSGMEIPTADCFFRVELETEDALSVNDDVEAVTWIPLEEVDAAAFGLDSIRRAVDIFLDRFTDK